MLQGWSRVDQCQQAVSSWFAINHAVQRQRLATKMRYNVAHTGVGNSQPRKVCLRGRDHCRMAVKGHGGVH